MDSVVHFWIPADDTGRAKKFYENAFGATGRTGINAPQPF